MEAIRRKASGGRSHYEIAPHNAVPQLNPFTGNFELASPGSVPKFNSFQGKWQMAPRNSVHRRTSRVLAFDPVRRAPCDTIPSSPHLAGVRKHERASPRCRTPEQAILIENWRRSQPKIPSRSEAVRQILEQALGDAEQHVAAMS